MNAGNTPLHEGEFISVNCGRRHVGDVDPRIQDVKILPVKILDVQLRLRLPPQVNPYQVGTENAPVHGHAQQWNDPEQVTDIFAGNELFHGLLFTLEVLPLSNY
jgi:hypothetical protein